MTEDQIPKMVARMVEHQRSFTSLSNGEAQWVIQKPKEAIALCIGAIKNHRSIGDSFFRHISDRETLTLDPVDGSEVLADALDVFVDIDPHFRTWKADEPGKSTGKTLVEVYEMKKDGNFEELFNSLSVNAREICLTQAQIMDFARKQFRWLRSGGCPTFFLFESHSWLFVAGVRVRPDGDLRVNVFRFRDSVVWSATRNVYKYPDHRPCVVIPKLT